MNTENGVFLLLKQVSNRLLGKISESLSDWIEDNAYVLVPPLPAQRYGLPTNAADLPADLVAHYTAKADSTPALLPSVSIYIIKKVNVSSLGAPFRNLQLFRPDMSPYTEDYFRNNYLLKQWLVPKHKVRFIEKAALVYDIWASQNYYHWLVESVPRLLMVRSVFPDVSILMPASVPAFISEILRMLEFDNLILIEKEDIAKVEELIIPQKMPFLEWQLESNEIQPHAFSLRVVREKLLLSMVLPPATTPSRRVYVSRSRQVARRLRNEYAIAPILAKYGVETVYFEEMSFRQQVELMQTTEVLIGLHGANLTNLMFMQHGTKVVELLNIDSARFLFYFFMAAYFNLAYYCMPCVSVDSVVTNQTDVEIDTEYFEKLLASVFAG